MKFDGTIVILTNKRKPEYIHKCIKSIRNEYKGIIHLMISGKDTKYLDRYKKGFVKHFSNEEGLTEPWKKACRGYSNCLLLNPGKGILIVEDDTRFVKGWLHKFVTFMKTIPDEKYVMSLGDAMIGSVPNPDIKVPSLQRFMYRVNIQRNPGKPPIALIVPWYDSHAVYYPPTLDRKELSDFMEHFAVEKNSMHDLIIGYFLMRKVYNIYLTVPSIAKNIGAYNTSIGLIPNLNSDYSDWDYSNW